MDLLATPLAGYIHGVGWHRPVGNGDFAVTRDAAGHVAAGGPPADDFGDATGSDVDPVLAPHDGIVTKASRVGSANLELDWTTPDGVAWRAVLAHNRLPHPVSVGQRVVAGQQVGIVGTTGATAQHLHLQYGYRAGLFWRWLDPWNHLEQTHNLQVNDGAVVNLRSAPALAGPIVGHTELAGIVVMGRVVAPHGSTLLRRLVAQVQADGYQWLPIVVQGVALDLWIARPFIHFV